MFQYQITSNQTEEFIDITYLINEALKQSGIKNGCAIVFCPHTTAGITINENADPEVCHDIIKGLRKMFPKEGDYRHIEGNSDAHLKSSYMGVEKTIIVHEGTLLLGTWQGVYFCEFDGPRNRKVYIKIIEERSQQIK